ncbi:MAG: OmpA family protein [Devosia sp.]
MRERRQDLRRTLRDKGERARNVERRQARRSRQLEWERGRTRRINRLRKPPPRRFFNDAVVVDNRRGRIVLRDHGRLIVINPGRDRFRWRADRVDVFVRPNGWRETVIIRPGGLRIITLSDERGLPIRRVRHAAGAAPVTLFNNLPGWWDDDSDVVVDVVPQSSSFVDEPYIEPSDADIGAVYDTVSAEPQAEVDRTYTLNQVLLNEDVRGLMPRVDVDTITFAMGSAVVDDDQIQALEGIGVAIEEALSNNANEIYLIEGHTDAVGSDIYNMALSDERAEAVATLLTEYFEIPPENLVTQGFGEQHLKTPTQGPSRENRRVSVRRITPLLTTDDQVAGLDDPDAPAATDEAPVERRAE